MPRVLVTPFMLHGAPGPYRDVLEGAGLEVVYPPRGVSLMEPAALLAHLEGVDAVLASIEPYNRDVLSKANVKAIARMGVGYDAIDVAAATELGIPVTITPGTNEIAVAELAMALLIGVCRGFPRVDHEVRSGDWKRKATRRIAGRTLGLVGLGRIGRAMVPRAQAFGLRVAACDPLADREALARDDVTLLPLEALLAEADIVSLHLPCTAETTNLFDAALFAQMKPGAVLVNTSRGGLVDETALAGALKSGQLAGAGLDVFQVEPLPVESPLLEFENVLLSSHVGGLDDESQVAMSRLAAQCIADLYQGRWPEGCMVNDSLHEGWRWPGAS